MTLDEAIRHAEEVAEEQDKKVPYKIYDDDEWTEEQENCHKCAEEHRQLAKWLKDYKRLLEQTELVDGDGVVSLNAVIKAVDKHTNDDGTLDDDISCILEDLPPVTPQPKTGHCKDCKHFRKLPYHVDTLGNTLGRCFKHTSFYPKGNWYCADFEPQERSE